MREEYRGYWITDYPVDGVAVVAVREHGRMCNAWSQAGTGDHQVGRNWVDEQLDGQERRSPEEYQQEIKSLRAELEAMRIAQRLEKGQRMDTPAADELVWCGRLMIPAGELNKGVVNEAYRKMAKMMHPDVGGDPELFGLIKEARDGLLKAFKG